MKEAKEKGVIVRNFEDNESEEEVDDMAKYDKNDRNIGPVKINVIPSPSKSSNQRIKRIMSQMDDKCYSFAIEIFESKD